MSKIKKFILSLIATLMVITVPMSCSDNWLEVQDPNRETSDNFWQTEEQFQQGLYAAYATLRRPGVFSRWFHVLHILRSDEGYSTSPNAEFQAVANFNMAPVNYDSNESIRLPWFEVSQVVYYVAQVVDNINDHGYDVMDKETADGILGQAYFLRGLCFWYMAGTYGKYPRQLSSTEDGEVILQEELYRQALSDFEASLILPRTWTSVDMGRPTHGSALGMMARCNMQLAGICKRPWENRPAEAQEFWAAAKKNIEDLFALGQYSLMPNYNDNFTQQFENNAESIFEINFKEGLVDGKETGMQRPKFLGLYIADGTGAWDDVSARDWMLEEYDKEKDKDGKTDMRKYYTLFYDDPSDTYKYYGKTYSEWKSQENFLKNTWWKKYTSVWDDNAAEDYSTGNNFRLLRLADVYLMYAECLNELNGDRATAVEYINKVRRRANMKDLSAGAYSSYDSLMEQLKHERFTELCGECTRWNDLDRWGDIHTQEGINKLAERDPDFSNFKVGQNHVYVIPAHEIALFPGLTQNPGY